MFSSFHTPTIAPTTSTALVPAGPSIDPRKREMYMCVPKLRGPLDKSFEVKRQCNALFAPRGSRPLLFLQEQRVEDYIKSFTATNMPPQPLPQEPTSDSARYTLGLPPLFQPHIEVVSSNGTTSPPSNATTIPSTGSGMVDGGAHVKEPGEIPDRQIFEWVRISGERERYMSISYFYSFFSQEVLSLPHHSRVPADNHCLSIGVEILRLHEGQQIPSTRIRPRSHSTPRNCDRYGSAHANQTGDRELSKHHLQARIRET